MLIPALMSRVTPNTNSITIVHDKLTEKTGDESPVNVDGIGPIGNALSNDLQRALRFQLS